MALGEKLFEESGNITAFRITRVHPKEGTTMEASFTSEIRGIGRFPNSKNMGSGTITQYPHGIAHASWIGTLTITEHRDQFMWWGHEKSKLMEDGNVQRVSVSSGIFKFTKLVLDE